MGARREAGRYELEDPPMATMDISLPDEMMAFVETQAAKEGFGSVSEYLCAPIRDLQKRRAKRDLEAKLCEAIESGPAEPMTREDWDAIEREGLERLALERSSR
jgi:antitoxin ParD1/3/4